MDQEKLEQLKKEVPVLEDVCAGNETLWVNPGLKVMGEAVKQLKFNREDMKDAEARLIRFAPFIQKLFPETEATKGILESPLTEIPEMLQTLNLKHGAGIEGRLFVKQDNTMPVVGSVKARGGFYDVLRVTEAIALESGLLTPEDLEGGKASVKAYENLAREDNRVHFGQYTLQVSSIGNLAISTGLLGSAIGFDVIVHVPHNVKKWKKDLLRDHNVAVLQYEGDYTDAVIQGRRLSASVHKNYYVDDVRSEGPLMGYSVAAIELEKQLKEQNIQIDAEHPLFVYIPCGVGGAPGGITFGLKMIYGDNVHCFFVEPANSPSMLAGLSTGCMGDIYVQELGLSGETRAEVLAVTSPSGFVAELIQPMVSGIFTAKDRSMYEYMRDLLKGEDIFLEPSAAAGFQGVVKIMRSRIGRAYLKEHGLLDSMENATHIVWGTGGGLIPEDVRYEYIHDYN